MPRILPSFLWRSSNKSEPNQIKKKNPSTANDSHSWFSKLTRWFRGRGGRQPAARRHPHQATATSSLVAFQPSLSSASLEAGEPISATVPELDASPVVRAPNRYPVYTTDAASADQPHHAPALTATSSLVAFQPSLPSTSIQACEPVSAINSKLHVSPVARAPIRRETVGHPVHRTDLKLHTRREHRHKSFIGHQCLVYILEKHMQMKFYKHDVVLEEFSPPGDPYVPDLVMKWTVTRKKRRRKKGKERLIYVYCEVKRYLGTSTPLEVQIDRGYKRLPKNSSVLVGLWMTDCGLLELEFCKGVEHERLRELLTKALNYSQYGAA